MQIFKYSTPPKDKFGPVEGVFNQPCKLMVVRDNFIRTIFELRNSANQTCYLFYEQLTQWPLGKFSAKICGLFQENYFEYLFVHDFLSGGIGGPRQAILEDKNGKIVARSEKIYGHAKKTKDLVIYPFHTLFLPGGTYHFQFNEYNNSVGFFDLNAYPKREVEIFDSAGVKCIWGGIRKPRLEIKIFQVVDNMHILLSMFISLYLPLAVSQHY